MPSDAIPDDGRSRELPSPTIELIESLRPENMELMDALQAATKIAQHHNPAVFTVLNVLYASMVIDRTHMLARVAQQWLRNEAQL